jgi:TolB-like protein
VLPESPASQSADIVRGCLEQLLESPAFRNSARLSRFLRVVVERTLEGGADNNLKESVVGVLVFDRPPDYDPKIDSIVRVQARQLRAKLQEYYSTTGMRDAVRFELPKGSYAPVIRRAVVTDGPRLVPMEAPSADVAVADLAVLPFLDLSSDPENEYFSDGISEEILSVLAQVRGLRLIARTSSFQFKGRNRDVRQIARQLGARSILEGSVRRAGNQLRITAQLIEGVGGTHLWAENFDAFLTDPGQVIAIQEDIAREISQRLGKFFPSAPAESTDSPRRPATVAAYDNYLRARKLLCELRPESIHQAMPLLEAAIAEDPDYAAAYAALADAYAHLGIYGGLSSTDLLPRAKKLAAEAVRRDPKLADGHTVLGKTAAALDLDLASAEAHFRRALEVDPQNAQARQSRAQWYLGPAGKTAEALTELEMLLPLDPLSLELRHTYVAVLYLARRYRDAIEQASLILQLMPQSFAAYFYRFLAYDALGETDRAMDDLKSHATNLSTLLLDQHVAAYQLERDGRHPEALEVARRMEDDPRSRIAPTVLADLWIRLGDRDRAVDWLERAYEWRVFRVLWIGVDATYDVLRGHPRFEALRSKILGTIS